MGSYIKNRAQGSVDRTKSGLGLLALVRLLGALALLCMIAGMAGIYIPNSKNRMLVHNAEIVIVLDVSNSMNMRGKNEDASALSEAKDHIRAFLSSGTDLLVSLIAYKGQAIELVPSTPAYGFVLDALDWVQSASISTRGTSLKGALDLALANLRSEYSLVLVYTDGNSPAPDKQLADLYVRGAEVYLVGCGSSKPSVVKDSEGNPVLEGAKPLMLARNRQEMEAWARKGKAHYHDLEDKDAGNAVLGKLQKVSASRGTEIIVSKPLSITKYAALSAFLLLALAYLLLLKAGPSGRNP